MLQENMRRLWSFELTITFEIQQREKRLTSMISHEIQLEER